MSHVSAWAVLGGTSDPPPCRWARSGRVLKSFAQPTEPQFFLLGNALGARTQTSTNLPGRPACPLGFGKWWRRN
eukprot:7122754-Pyramimonas_sp.AAC.1